MTTDHDPCPLPPSCLINVQEKRRRRNYVPPFLPPIFSPRSRRAYSLRSQRILLTYLFIVRNGNLNFVLYVIFELVVVFKFKSKGVFRCGVLMRVADRRSDRHGWMEVAANGGRQLSRVLARVVIDGGRGERGIVCCGIVGPSWKCSTCSRETVSRASLSLALSYTTVYKLSAERVLPLGCCFSLRRGEVLLYRAYPRRDIERIYVYIYVYSPSPFAFHS